MASVSASSGKSRHATADNEHFLLVLRATASAISCAGIATLQARQLLITQTATPLGEAAVIQATSGLATAYSLGSVAEFFLSPVFGRMSDRFGRKPIMLFFMVGPAIMRTLCALVEHPVTRIRLLPLLCDSFRRMMPFFATHQPTQPRIPRLGDSRGSSDMTGPALDSLELEVVGLRICAGHWLLA